MKHGAMAVVSVVSAMSSLAATQLAPAQAVEWRVADGGNGHWYQGVETGNGIGWASAQAACVSAGGSLVSIGTAAESSWLYETVARRLNLWSNVGPYIDGPWIGARGASGQWRWDDGTPWNYSAWYPGEGPPSGDPREQFAHFFNGVGTVVPNNSWGDYFDEPFNHSYIIEWSADCSNDGLVDYGQIKRGELPDFNGNNIPDCCEQGSACAVGSYPLQWRVVDGGNGHWYQLVVSGPVTWTAAKLACEDRGGHLVTPTSLSENDFVTQLGSRAEHPAAWVNDSFGNAGGPWLGGYQPSNAPIVQPWAWVSGEPWAWTGWAPGEPNGGYAPGVSVTSMLGYSGSNYYRGWADAGLEDFPTYPLPPSYIIEWSADCNNDGLVDYGQILDGTLADSDHNGVPNACECVADRDGDGFVGASDLSIVLTSFGSPKAVAAGDVNHDGVVNAADLGLVLNNWGACH